MGNPIFFILLALSMLTNCSLPPVRRNQQGLGPMPQRPDFNPVKKKLAVLPFVNEAPVGGADLAVVAHAELSKELSKVRDFKLSPEGAQLFGPSKKIYYSAGQKLAQVSRKAKMAGIHLVVFGRIVHARVRQQKGDIGLVRQHKSMAEADVEIRIYDVHNQKEIFAQTLKSQFEDKTFRFAIRESEENLAYRRDLLRYVVKDAVRKVIPAVAEIGKKLSWIGRVAKIIGNKIYVNAGRQSGLFVGDILKVITEGQEIYDPETGALIGISQGETKGTLEITDFFGPDGSVTILHSGGSVTEGDFVMLY